MQDTRELPEVQFCVGDKRTFAVVAVLPALRAERQREDTSASAILGISDGGIAIFVGGVNVVQIEEGPNVSRPWIAHCPLSLSMVLEWVFYDAAFNLESGSKTFSAIIAGEASPDIRFELAGSAVRVKWDLRDWSRKGNRYTNPRGEGTIAYSTYLLTLATLADGLIAAIEWRVQRLGYLAQWHLWLSGYQGERDAFYEFVRSRINGTE